MPLESVLKRNVLKRLKLLLPLAAVRKRHGSVFGVAGDPDVMVLTEGRHLEMELKRPGESPTPLQIVRRKEWERAGAHYAVVHTVEELDDFLTHLVELGVLAPFQVPVPKSTTGRKVNR